MTQVITESLQDCEEPDLFLGIKLLVLSFIHTMEVGAWVFWELARIEELVLMVG